MPACLKDCSLFKLMLFPLQKLGAKKDPAGNSLVIQWLRLCASIAGMWVSSLVQELRSHMLCSMAKKQANDKTPARWAGNRAEVCRPQDKSPKHLLSLVEKVLVGTPKDGQKIADLILLTVLFCAGMCHLCFSDPICRMGI